MTIDFYAFQREAEDRSRELGLDDPDVQEALRNKGEGRTAAKREFLARIERRAAAAGKVAPRAFY